MKHQPVSRRSVLKGGGAALAGLSVLRVGVGDNAFGGQSRGPDLDAQAGSAQAFPGISGEVIPWLDQPPPSPIPDAVGNLLDWEEVDSFLTPANDFFFVQHYGQPGGLDEATWRVGIEGLVARPRSLTIADLKAEPRREVDFTLECSGNTAFDFFIGGIGTARWGGAQLSRILQHAGVLDEATEVIFWGADRGTLTIRDNPGILSGGVTGSVTPDGEGGLDLTIAEHFARSMSLTEALNPDNLLCYEMNGEPLPPEHGFPLRLIAPGWYGVANVKWLNRIEVTNRRFTGRFMARDYVSIREQQRGGELLWTFSNVGGARLKSAPVKVVRLGNRYAVVGTAWGAPIERVEVRIDHGPWTAADLLDRPPGRKQSRGYAWNFWTLNWGTVSSGEHHVTSRAFDADGNMQPSPDDPFLASRRTYWEANGHITRRVLIS